MKYNILLFDIDDTLLDFNKNESVALKKLFNFYNVSEIDNLHETYQSINKTLWRNYEAGDISIEQVLNSRFKHTMRMFDKEVDGYEWEKRYREYLGEGYIPIENAKLVCKTLSKTHRLFAVTNGVRETQIKRLKKAEMLDFFEDIFDSESIGYQKPSRMFFEYVQKHISDFTKKESLIIGDSLSSDIKGGIDFGIDTCHYNPKNKYDLKGIESLYTVSNLLEVIDICKEK